jgi:hypothetical protein
MERVPRGALSARETAVAERRGQVVVLRIVVRGPWSVVVGPRCVRIVSDAVLDPNFLKELGSLGWLENKYTCNFLFTHWITG